MLLSGNHDDAIGGGEVFDDDGDDDDDDDGVGGDGFACILFSLPPPRATYDGDSYLISHQNIQQLPNIQIGPSILYQPRDGGFMLNSIVQHTNIGFDFHFLFGNDQPHGQNCYVR